MARRSPERRVGGWPARGRPVLAEDLRESGRGNDAGRRQADAVELTLRAENASKGIRVQPAGWVEAGIPPTCRHEKSLMRRVSAHDRILSIVNTSLTSVKGGIFTLFRGAVEGGFSVNFLYESPRAGEWVTGRNRAAHASKRTLRGAKLRNAAFRG